MRGYSWQIDPPDDDGSVYSPDFIHYSELAEMEREFERIVNALYTTGDLKELQDAMLQLGMMMDIDIPKGTIKVETKKEKE